MSKQQADEIRNLVDRGGWEAVRSHPVLGPIWRAELAKSREYVNRVVDR